LKNGTSKQRQNGEAREVAKQIDDAIEEG